MSSAWSFQWGEPWGSGTKWNQHEGPRPGEGDLVPIPPGDLDAVTTAEERIWKQFEGTATWAAMCGVLGLAHGDVEHVMAQLEPMRYVGTATGVWLDRVGELVNLPRAGWTDDDDYRLAIIAEALSEITTGAPDEIIDLALRLAPDPEVVRYYEGVASFVLVISDLTGARFDLIRAVMRDMPPAGVGAWLDTYETDTTAGPGWDPQPSPVGAPGWDPQPSGILADHGWGAVIG